jgi:hypothetical protein
MAWTDTVFKFISYGRYNTITPALTNGQISELQVGADGRLLVNAQATSTVWSDGGISTSERVVKAAAGKMYQIFGRNTGATDKYIFIFNHGASGGSRPANGSTAAIFVPVKVRAGEAFSIDIQQRPRAFSTGLYWGVSSTDATFTYDATGTMVVAAEYE